MYRTTVTSCTSSTATAREPRPNAQLRYRFCCRRLGFPAFERSVSTPKLFMIHFGQVDIHNRNYEVVIGLSLGDRMIHRIIVSQRLCHATSYPSQIWWQG